MKRILPSFALVPLLLFCAAPARADGPALVKPSEAELALARKFAPLVVLAQGEAYFPSSIEFFAPYTTFACKSGGGGGSIFAPPGSTDGCHLTTKEKMKGPDQILGFFKGQSPATTKVPVYVSFYKAKSGALNIQYLTFFPYNWGKNVCLSLAPKDHCLAKRHQMDNHVGDWEGMTVQVQGDKLVGVRIGAHAASRIGFTFLASAKGACPNQGGSKDLNHTGPLSCLQLRDGHPVVYAAWGSHGLWGTEGKHNYQTLPTGEELVDHTSKGVEWRTWEAIAVYDDSRYPFKFRGRWGNLPAEVPHNANACKLSSVPGKLCGPAGIPSDEWELNDGPGTPDYNRDWEKLP